MPGDRRLTVRLIANELCMNRHSVWKAIAEDLDIERVCVKIVLKFLSDNQKDWYM